MQRRVKFAYIKIILYDEIIQNYPLLPHFSTHFKFFNGTKYLIWQTNSFECQDCNQSDFFSYLSFCTYPILLPIFTLKRMCIIAMYIVFYCSWIILYLSLNRYKYIDINLASNACLICYLEVFFCKYNFSFWSITTSTCLM